MRVGVGEQEQYAFVCAAVAEHVGGEVPQSLGRRAGGERREPGQDGRGERATPSAPVDDDGRDGRGRAGSRSSSGSGALAAAARGRAGSGRRRRRSRGTGWRRGRRRRRRGSRSGRSARGTGAAAPPGRPRTSVTNHCTIDGEERRATDQSRSQTIERDRERQAEEDGQARAAQVVGVAHEPHRMPRRRLELRQERRRVGVRVAVGDEEQVRERLRPVAERVRAGVTQPARHAAGEEAREPAEERDRREHPAGACLRRPVAASRARTDARGAAERGGEDQRRQREHEPDGHAAPRLRRRAPGARRRRGTSRRRR